MASTVYETDNCFGEQPTICFPVNDNRERNNIAPFTDTSVTRDANGYLTTTVYGKPGTFDFDGFQLTKKS